MSGPQDADAFTSTWHSDAPRVAAYARRHVPVEDVHDVVAETFLQAWRRWPDVTQPPIAWLIGTARKVIGNHRRARQRRGALRDRLRLLEHAAAPAPDAGMLAAERLAALESLARLPFDQREALLLVAWDGLSPEQAAEALGIRPGTFRVRAHRARRSLEQADTPEPAQPPHILEIGEIR